jgi:cellulose synthase/poly-beta-1,6-N-acetylglucosamine synthase-like glycosyltransferase
MLLMTILLFLLSLFLVLHSYLLFPAIIKLLAIGKKNNTHIYNIDDEDLPRVSILLAVFNEEQVIENKITTTFNTNYPKHKITLYIGSDDSKDTTNEIIRKYKQEFPQIKFELFKERTGKSNIINKLSTLTDDEVLIMTDANVFFNVDTIFNLLKHYKNAQIGLVGGNILNHTFKKEGISYQEKTYLTIENKIKYHEGLIWGSMIGAQGGCYSIRKKLFAPVPSNFLVDDFFISMNVLQKEFKTINELDAVCNEDVSNKISEEFRRKVRISIGNFQNLSIYKNLLWTKGFGIAFSFLSHKVLRWFAPLFIIINIFTGYALFMMNVPLFKNIFTIQLISLLIPMIDTLLKKANIHLTLFRFITHFYLMNLALLLGIIQYLKGVKTNVWEPTERNQQ